MSPESLRKMMHDVASGALAVEEAMRHLATMPYADLGHTLVDHHRETRQGFPETIYGAGKTAAQITEILLRVAANHGRAMATRVVPGVAEDVMNALPDAVYDPVSRLLRLGDPPTLADDAPMALVLCAGTSDLPVARETEQTLAFLGQKVEFRADVGVAGLHRLLAQLDLLRAADVIIVVAGMEGALASVVGGLADCPVLAVPTSVGYGVSGGGHAALHTMLSSCAAGIGVFNIDNGHGAAILAHQILRRARPKVSIREIS